MAAQREVVQREVVQLRQAELGLRTGRLAPRPNLGTANWTGKALQESENLPKKAMTK